MDADIGDKITIISPNSIMSLMNSSKQKSFIVDSNFESEINEFNQNIAFLNLNDLEDFFGLEKQNDILRYF